MKKSIKAVYSVLLSFLVLFLSSTPALADFSSGSVDYVAFGDSVAAGVRGGLSEKSSACGYTDDIATNLKCADVLSGFSKSFCTSGMTAAKLAENTAVLRDRSSDAYALVNSADLVTLTIGGNDLLVPLYSYINTLSGGQSPDISELKTALSKVAEAVYDGKTAPAVQANIETILHNILSAAPKAQIYVMGYYNPLPLASILAGVDLNAPLRDFNAYIQKAVTDIAAENPDAALYYVDTMSAMSSNYSDNLAITDIHPTEAGYHVIAEEFWKQIKKLVPSVKTVSLSLHSVLADGTAVTLAACNIDGSNYIKLRDLAQVLSGGKKQFSVDWNAKKSEISLTPSSVYASVGGELSLPGNGSSVRAVSSPFPLYISGTKADLTAYNIDGCTYFRLRDLASELNFGVDWDPETDTIKIDSSLGYVA